MANVVLLVGAFDIDQLGFSLWLSETEEYALYHAKSIKAAKMHLSEKPFHAVIIDTILPDGDPIELLSEIRSTYPNQPVLLLARQEHPAATAKAASLGALGVILKSDSYQIFMSKLEKALQGKSHWTKDELRRIAVSAAAIPSSNDYDVPLTQREGDVLQHLAQGRTNKEIAQALEISYETVKEHVQHILRKVGVNDRTQAAVWAVRRQVI